MRKVEQKDAELALKILRDLLKRKEKGREFGFRWDDEGLIGNAWMLCHRYKLIKKDLYDFM